MATPQTLAVGLKEWASVCAALERGRQIILLRKGGIHESAGEFELEHPWFLLFPTYLHQNAQMLKEGERAGLTPVSAEPTSVMLAIAGHATDIIQLRSRSQMDAIEEQHIWTPPLIDMRFSYRPENPLYLLLVRAYRLPRPATIPNTPAYAGCKSWVPLETPIDTAGATPVLNDFDYDERRAAIRHRIGQA